MIEQRAHTRVALALFLVAATATAACGRGRQAAGPAAAPGAAPDAASDGDELLVDLAGNPVTMADVEAEVGAQIAQIEFQYRSQRQQLIEDTARRLLRERVLAAEADRRGMTRDDLVSSLLDGQIEVSDADVSTFYEQNRAGLQGRTLEELGPQIRQYLRQQRANEIVSDRAAELAEEAGVVWHLEPFRVDVADTEAPAFGPETAPVTLVEFSDFQCPYCRSFNATLERIKSDYGDRVRIVFRHFPLDQIHPQARKAAEAAMCAGEQGQFWEMHDLIFAEQSRLQVPDLKDKAQRLGLDTEAFTTCLDSGRHADAIEQDRRAGIQAGVSGTPQIYVNGRPVQSGAVPFEVVAEVIEDELSRVGQ